MREGKVELNGSSKAAASTAPAAPRSTTILLGLVLLTACAELLLRYEDVPFQEANWLIGDCRHYRDVTRAILRHGTVAYSIVNPLEVRRYAPGSVAVSGPTDSNVSLAKDGTLVPVRPILFPLALLIPYALLQEWGLLLFNVAQCSVLVLMVYWLARRFVSEFAALLAACGFLADSPLRVLLYNVSPDVFGTVLVFGGVLCVWGQEAPRTRLFLGGLLMGLSLWLRVPNVLALVALLPLLLATIRHRRGYTRILWVLGGLCIGLSGSMVYNTVWFGNPFVTSYDRVLVVRGGVWQTVSMKDSMNRPFLESIFPTFFDSPMSFLAAAPHWPLLLLALPAIGRQRAADALVLAALVLLPVLFLVKFDYWAVSHQVNRFMVLPSAFSAVALAWAIEGIVTRRYFCIRAPQPGPPVLPDADPND